MWYALLSLSIQIRFLSLLHSKINVRLRTGLWLQQAAFWKTNCRCPLKRQCGVPQILQVDRGLTVALVRTFAGTTVCQHLGCLHISLLWQLCCAQRCCRKPAWLFWVSSSILISLFKDVCCPSESLVVYHIFLKLTERQTQLLHGKNTTKVKAREQDPFVVWMAQQ